MRHSHLSILILAALAWLLPGALGASIPGTLRVTAPIAPADSADTYPTHMAAYGKGGMRTVADLAARDAIPAARREEGMLVYVQSPATLYRLGSDLTTWTQLQIPSYLDWITLNGEKDTLEAQSALARRLNNEAIPLTLFQSSPRVSIGFVRNSDALDPASGGVAGTNVIRAIPLAFGSALGAAVLVERQATNIRWGLGVEPLMAASRLSLDTNAVGIGPWGVIQPLNAYTDNAETNAHHIYIGAMTNSPGNRVTAGVLFKPNNPTNMQFALSIGAETNGAWVVTSRAWLTNQLTPPEVITASSGPVTFHHASYTPLGHGWWYGNISATVTNVTGVRFTLGLGGFQSYVGNTNSPAVYTAGYYYSANPDADEVHTYPPIRPDRTLILSKAPDVYTFTNSAPWKSTEGTLLIWLRNGFQQPANATLIETSPSGGLRVEISQTNLLVAAKDQGAGVSINAAIPAMSYLAERQLGITWTTNGLKAFLDGTLVGTSAPPVGGFAWDSAGRIGSALAGTNYWNGHIGAAYVPRAISENDLIFAPSVVGPPNP